jgi:hypothetical protein
MPTLTKSKGAKGSSDSLTQLLKRIQKKSKTRSHRSQSKKNTRSKSKTPITPVPRDPLVHIKSVLQFYFETIGYEIQQTDPNFIPPTADEFLYVCKQVNNNIAKEIKGKKTNGTIRTSASLQTILTPSSIQIGGSLGRITALAIGTFDTTCNQIFSCISIASYAAGAAAFLMPAGQMTGYAQSIFGYAATFIQHIFPMIAGAERLIVEALETVITPRIPLLTAEQTARGLSMAMNTILNERAFKKSLSCILLGFGVESCYPYCGFFGQTNENSEENEPAHENEFGDRFILGPA